MPQLTRIEHAGGVVTYRSPQLHGLGVPHGFTTRLGGASPAPFDSLHLGTTEGGEQFDENFRRLKGALGVADYHAVYVSQVHGCDVHVPGGDSCAGVAADALLTDKRGRLLSVRVADCVPLLLASADGAIVAAVHAGWRGVVASVAVRALEAMQERFGVAASEVVAAIGPCIGVQHFEVGAEVAQALAIAGLGEAVDFTRGAKPHVDLTMAVRRQLMTAGVERERIDTTDRCTYRHAAEFFSHRRDAGRTGRMAAVIAPAPRAG